MSAQNTEGELIKVGRFTMRYFCLLFEARGVAEYSSYFSRVIKNSQPDNGGGASRLFSL